MKTFFMVTALSVGSLVATNSIAWTNITSDFSNRFSSDFEGIIVKQGYKKIKERCLAEIAGRCLKKEIEKAKGQLTIKDYEGSSGQILRKFESDPLRPETGGGYNYTSTLVMNFNYSGLTRARKYVDGSFIDHDRPWEDLHGNITIKFVASAASKWQVNVTYHASPGHPDRANKFMARQVARHLQGHIKRIAEKLLHQEVSVRFN